MIPFAIEVRFQGGLTGSQQAVFEIAAKRWASVIMTDQRGPFAFGDSRAHLVIEAKGADLGGVGGILGQAGPTALMQGSGLPVHGLMEFDIADINRLELDGSLLNTIVHEMGHVLGLGTLWAQHKLIHRSNTDDPIYVGINAAIEYARLLGQWTPIPVPVENQGGPGTREGHWRETVFEKELMTGFLNEGRNPLSRLSIAALQDLGYQVNISAADSFSMPETQLTVPPGLIEMRCLENRPTSRVMEPKEIDCLLADCAYESRLIVAAD